MLLGVCFLFVFVLMFLVKTWGKALKEVLKMVLEVLEILSLFLIANNVEVASDYRR